ncbi:homeodomain-interacting protein kinase 3-like [Pempheris klunzingeri]|uniref:homeodomain-interacting protein kinase 3-like n=1 Tax=Pempheris klunzingeri TaxID=3127111 RepID=UPI003980AD8F
MTTFSVFHTDELQIYKGSSLGGCLRVEAFLGEGGFGFVTKCRNTETDEMVAIKVNKSHPEIVHQARREIAILKLLRCLDPDTCNIVRCNGYFFNRDHICLNFELLDQSLHSYMEDRANQGLPMAELRPVLNQLAAALSHLSSMGVAHADLKPENVMVVDRRQKPLRVKLIDFGLACPVFPLQPGVCLQTIWYRAPEVMLHIPFNEAIDMWSLGLVAAELATGYPLYPGEMNYDVLSFIIETQGQPADYVLDRGKEEFKYETGFQATETRYIQLKSLDDLEQLMVRSGGQQRDQRLLVHLIKMMLQLDADQRIKPLEVLQHPFFAHSLPQSSCPETCLEMVDSDELYPAFAPSPHLSSRTYTCIEIIDTDEETPKADQQSSRKSNDRTSGQLLRDRDGSCLPGCTISGEEL